MVPAFRITSKKYTATAFDGEGARLFGGRWNSKGTRMVYLASSYSLATLELLVHAEDYSLIEGNYDYVPVEIPDRCIEILDTKKLPANWNSPTVYANTQVLGDAWCKSETSVVLGVPSAVSSEERNFLVNPLHPDFGMLDIGDPVEYRLDPRLIR